MSVPSDNYSAAGNQIDSCDTSTFVASALPANSDNHNDNDTECAESNNDRPIASCVSKTDFGGITTALIPIAIIVMGLLCIAFGYAGKVPEALTRAEHIQRMNSCGIGIAILGGVIGLIMMVFYKCNRTYGVEVFEDRVELVTKKKIETIPWSEIDRVDVSHFSGGAGFSATTTLSAQYGRKSAISVSTLFAGTPKDVMDAFITRCHYIVENPEGYRK